MHKNLLKNVRISRLWGSSGPVTASTAVYSRAVDMHGFEGCLFILQGSSVINDGTTGAYMRLQAANTTAGTFYSLSGSTASSTGGVAGGNWSSNSWQSKTLAIDLYRPLSTHRHVRCVIVGASSGNINAITAIQYGARHAGSTDIWKGSTRAGSTRWLSTQIGGQTLVVTPAVTTASTK